MPRTLRVLLAEDSPSDAELTVRELRKAGFSPEWHRVDTEADYIASLHPDLDIILSDYSMPQFGGIRALEILNERGLEIPFIIVSGTIGEDTAVAAMKNGATDYLLKDRLARLGPAVELAVVLSPSELRRFIVGRSGSSAVLLPSSVFGAVSPSLAPAEGLAAGAAVPSLFPKCGRESSFDPTITGSIFEACKAAAFFTAAGALKLPYPVHPLS